MQSNQITLNILNFMKYLLFTIFLLCSVGAYGQDLIVTTTGDSLKCKIIEIDADEIQFRFGTNGNVISIKKSETAMYEYNFVPAPFKVQPKEKKKKEKTQRISSSEHLPYYVAISGGATTFGSISFGEVNCFEMAFGADGAYFFTPWIGAGLKLSATSCDIKFNEPFAYRDIVMFGGGALFGRWEKDRLFVIASAGAGAINWMLMKQVYNEVKRSDKSLISVGGIVSAGVGYSLTPQIGVSFNAQSIIGSVKDKEGENTERNPLGIGCTFGINYRF